MSSRPAATPIVLAALLMLGAPAWALYKVVGPDGQVTYSDRPPAEPAARVQQLSSQATPVPTNNLPIALREPVARYPVALYTTRDCEACTMARNFLGRRGVPYAESTIDSPEDRAMFKSRFNSTSVPVVTIGGQKLETFDESKWASYLDAAGYPKTSALPASYKQPQATPLAPRAGDAARGPTLPSTPMSDAPQRLPEEPSTPAPAGFKF